MPSFPLVLLSRKNDNIEVSSVETLNGDHDAEGTRMALSISGWLDVEVGYWFMKNQFVLFFCRP